MFAQTKNRRALFGVIAANAFEDRRAVTYDVRKNVQLRIVPVNPFAVVPNFFGLLNRHNCSLYCSHSVCRIRYVIHSVNFRMRT